MTDIAAVNQVLITGKDRSGPAFDSAISRTVALGKAASDISGSINGVFAALGVGAFAAAITGAIEMEAQLYRLAQATGVPVEALSAMRTAAKLTGTDMEAVAKGLERFALNITTAASGTGKVADALNRLGLDAKTFSSQFATTDQAILAVAQKLDQYQDGLGKTATAQALLGRSGAALIPFLHEIAVGGLDAIKVTAAQAQAANELERSWTKLKATFTAIVVAVANTLIPVLQAVINGLETFKTIAVEAIAALVVWPAVVGLAETALIAYREAALSAALANEVLGMSTSTTGVLFSNFFSNFAGSFKTLFGTVASFLTSTGALIFASVASWQIGTWAREQFVEVRVAAIVFVEYMLKAWEDIKYFGQLAWEVVKLGFFGMVNQLKTIFGGFVELLGKGLSVVGLDTLGEQVQAFGRATQATATGAITNFDASVKKLGEGNEKAKRGIEDITRDMMLLELQTVKTAKVPELKPPLPAGSAKEIGDLTKSLDAYEKALAGVAKAGAEALAKIQLDAIKNSQTDLDRSYQRGLIGFKAYWDQRIALENAALDVEQTKLQTELDAELKLRDAIQERINALDPSKFKTLADYENTLTKAETDRENAVAKLVTIQGALVQVTEKRNQVGKDEFELLQKEYPAILQNVKGLQDQVAAQQLANDTLGLAASQIQLVIAARDQDLLAQQRAAGASDDTIAALEKEIATRQQLAGVLKTGEDAKAQLDLVRQGTDALEKGIVDVAQHGMSGFKNMWESFKQWGLEAIAKIAAQKIVLSIVGALSPGLAGAAEGSFGQNPLQTLLGIGGGGGSGGGLGSLLGNLFGGGGAGGITDALGVSGDAMTALFGGVPAAGAGLLSGLGALGAAVPYLGLAIAAVGLISSFLKKDPSQVKGQFGVSAGTTGFEDNAFTGSKFGNLGFLDANTQQFSGEAAQVLNKIVSGALDAFAGRMSEDQQKRLADILQNTTFATQEGTFTTEDFLQKYGGQVLQQVVTAAFSVLDPALGDVAARFVGTADEVSTFANTLLAVYDASKDFSVEFKDNIVAALADATQATADKVLAFVAVVAQFGDSIEGLGPKLEALDPTSMIAFVDALGGAAAMAASFAYLGQNFLTTADRLAQNTNTLNKDFADLGIKTIPATHAQFLALLNSFDLTTAAGRDMYAAVLNLSSLFVAVHGTADAAATAVNGVSNALSSAAQSAEDFFNANFYTAAEQQAKKTADELRQLADASTALGISIPNSIAGFRALIEGIDQSSEAGRALYAALIVLAPVIFDLNSAAAAAAASVQDLSNQIPGINNGPNPVDVLAQQAQTFIDQAAALANQLQNSDVGAKLTLQMNLVGQKIAEVQARIAAYIAAGQQGQADLLTGQLAIFLAQNQFLTNALADYTVLKAQYGEAIAGQLVDLETWYQQQQKLLGDNNIALAALAQIYFDRWNAIISGTSDGVDGTLTELERLRKGIADYLKSLQISDLSPLTPAQKLAAAKAQFDADFAKAQGGDLVAMGRLTADSDAYLRLARDFFASSQQYTDIFNLITGELQQLVDVGNPAPGTGDPIPGQDFGKLNEALPTNGAKLASKDDISAQTTAIIEALMAHADAGTADAGQVTKAIDRARDTLSDKLRAPK